MKRNESGFQLLLTQKKTSLPNVVANLQPGFVLVLSPFPSARINRLSGGAGVMSFEYNDGYFSFEAPRCFMWVTQNRVSLQ